MPNPNTPTSQLKVVKPGASEASIEEAVSLLEHCGGDLEQFLTKAVLLGLSREQYLFGIELKLSKAENLELKRRWQKALKLSAKVRMDLLRCKAFTTLEEYKNISSSSSAADISFAKAMLVGILVEDSESVKFKYRPIAVPGAGGQTATEDQECDALEDEFDKAGG